jgi:hypothetical protein
MSDNFPWEDELERIRQRLHAIDRNGLNPAELQAAICDLYEFSVELCSLVRSIIEKASARKAQRESGQAPRLH